MVIHMTQNEITAMTVKAQQAALKALQSSRAAGSFGNAGVAHAAFAACGGHGLTFEEAAGIADGAIHWATEEFNAHNALFG